MSETPGSQPRGKTVLRRLTPRKLLHSKWTAVAPRRREKHFIVVRVIEPELALAPIEQIEIEAVHSRRRTVIDWRELRDAGRWHQGWR